MIDRDGRPAGLSWTYDRREILVDGVVHALGVSLGLVGVAILVTGAAARMGPWETAAVLVYAGGLLTMLGLSAAYNLWPISPTKWWLRRFDHSAIYVMIAGTYTPFLTQIPDRLLAVGLLAWVWGAAIVGVTLKIAWPGRWDRLSLALYLLISWSIVVAYGPVSEALPGTTLRLIAAGGILYTSGVIFHLWESLRFHNAVWHLFVLAAAACHWGAVLDCMVLAKAGA